MAPCWTGLAVHCYGHVAYDILMDVMFLPFAVQKHMECNPINVPINLTDEFLSTAGQPYFDTPFSPNKVCALCELNTYA
jgi:hypothetical protein